LKNTYFYQKNNLMKTITTLILTLVYSLSIAQNSTILDQNNVGAHLNTNGIFFNDLSTNANGGYLAPKDSTTSVIYSSAFWFGGTDSNGGLHLAAGKFGDNDDYFCGPISTDYAHADYLDLYENKFWKITKVEINNHKLNFDQPNYSVPTLIAEWPANGSASIGVANDMAPYVDENENGVYDPENGDYPNIRGDMAVYIIMNDDADVHAESGGEKLGMEFHYMFYQFNSNDYLDSTTFINLKVINRSVNTYSNFKVGYYVDPDIGGSSDDYVGCSPSENLMFGYNGDNNDDGTGGATYGVNPPAVGIKFLNHDLDVFSYYTGGNVSPTTDPNAAAEYYGFMNAMWGNSGLPFTYGGTGINGTVPTNHIFPGSLSDLSEWSEISEIHPVGDRRMVGVTEGNTIVPNQVICYDYAVLYNRSGGTIIENVVGLNDLSVQVQGFYDGEVNFSCDNVVLNTKESSISNFEMYPNPSNGEINLSSNSIFDVIIYSINGEEVYSKANVNSKVVLNLDVTTGIYFVKVTQDNSTFTKKIIIK